MQAGLSAASGTSPNALKNIADGMNVGLSSYKESLKEFKKAEKERQKAMADIEQARRAEARGDADTAIKATERSEDRMDKFNGYSMQGIAALTSQSMQESGNIARTNAQIAANRENTLIQERGMNARAGAPSASMREAMLLGTGNTDAERYQSGLKKMQELTGDKQGMQMLKLFLEENARREKNMEKPLTLEQFRRTSSAFFAPPAPVDTRNPTRP